MNKLQNDVNSVKFEGGIYPIIDQPSAPNMTDSTNVEQTQGNEQTTSRFETVKTKAKEIGNNVVDATRLVGKSTVNAKASEQIATKAANMVKNLGNFIQEKGLKAVSTPLFFDGAEIDAPVKAKKLNDTDPDSYEDSAYIRDDSGVQVFEKKKLAPVINFKAINELKEEGSFMSQPGVRLSNVFRRAANSARADIMSIDRIASKSGEIAFRAMQSPFALLIGRAPVIGRPVALLVAGATRLVVGTVLTAAFVLKQIFKALVAVIIAAVALATSPFWIAAAVVRYQDLQEINELKKDLGDATWYIEGRLNNNQEALEDNARLQDQRESAFVKSFTPSNNPNDFSNVYLKNVAQETQRQPARKVANPMNIERRQFNVENVKNSLEESFYNTHKKQIDENKEAIRKRMERQEKVNYPSLEGTKT